MITYLQAIILGGIQGIAELFPVSSLGHSILIPELFKWNLSQNSESFLVFLVATHLATSLVLFWYFRKDWARIITGIFRSLKDRVISDADTYAKIGWLLVVGTIPAGILGLLFEDALKSLLSSPRLVALFLVANGLLLFGVERLTKRSSASGELSHNDSRIAGLSWFDSVRIGFAQCLALVPGFSRTGATLGGGLLVGLGHEDAVRFSFLLATPIIFAAAALKLPELVTGHGPALGPIAAGFASSAVAAYFSVRFLTNYFKTKTLVPFAMYCIAFGGVFFVLVTVR